MSDTSGIQTFFGGLGQHLARQIARQNAARHFCEGSRVYYSGSKVADHGWWFVVGHDDDGMVEIGRNFTKRRLLVRPQSISHRTACATGVCSTAQQ